MFTVKHIHLDGSEEIHETEKVRFTPAGSDLSPTTSSAPDTLWIDSGPLTGGTLFVMNASGKTVSRYDLGASFVPLFDADFMRESQDINRADKLQQATRIG
jgi:hypothetical protein